MRGRTKGGQPKNQNARKHGFYSEAFGKSLAGVFRHAETLDKKQLADEIDALRTCLNNFIDVTKTNRTPNDLNTVALLSRTIIRAVAVHHGLTPEQENGIHQALRDLINDLIPRAGGL